jgi:arabinogalactan endo-1,4-beta-galactosidase
MIRFSFFLLFVLIVTVLPVKAQLPFYFGADLSYVNQMEDCGVVYREQGQPKEVFQIFADHHCNLVRLRLWHTPAWCDTLNAGLRYSDLNDVQKSLARAKAKGMQALLDFHLSDTWADPGRQLVPTAWEGVVNNLPLLKDSVYNYISSTLISLNAKGLLPEMVQIGNETNRGILLSPAVDAAGWSLDWNRNSQLFKRAIQAVRDVESQTGKQIKVALHISGPTNAGWLMQGFWANGVTDFDVIGLSYYWAWHKPTTISEVGDMISGLKQNYPGKAVMIFETGYAWTNQWEDSANNIITETDPVYGSASPENQQNWLVDLTQEVIDRGGSGVLYWEPAWQSSVCWTPWGQGSHQEHATFFNFQDNLLEGGGMDFMTYPYEHLVSTNAPASAEPSRVWLDNSQRNIHIYVPGKIAGNPLKITLLNSQGVQVFSLNIDQNTGSELEFGIPDLPAGLYFCAVYESGMIKAVQGLVLVK